MAIGWRSQAATILAIIAFCTLFYETNGKSSGISAVAEATTTLKVVKAVKLASGGHRGRIPIGYMKYPGRNGHYYLPAGYNGTARPIMILLHGSAMNGVMMIQHFGWLADKYQFIIVAPDSGEKLYWFTAKSYQKFTTDWYHVQACYNYVKRLEGVAIDYSRVAYAGFSRGGYSAAALATRTNSCTHGLVIHSSLTVDQLGSHKVPIRFSTGTYDPMFTPSLMAKRVASFKNLTGLDLSLKIFKGGHSLSDPGELESDVRWWLGADS